MSIIKHHRNRMSGGGSRSASISDRVHRYALTAAGVTAAAVPGGVAMAGGVPPTSAASAGGWSWSNTLLNNATGAPGGAVNTLSIWGAGGSLLSNNIIVGMRRFNNGLGAAGTFRDVFLSQTGWNPGNHYVAFGGPALAGAVVSNGATGGGATNWTPPAAFALGFLDLARSTRAGTVANTTAAWGTQPTRTVVMGKSARMYLTFRIQDFGNTYYGWLDLQTQEDASKNLTFTIHGWAYSTGSIVVGPVAIPGGTGLAALALGAAGLRGRRRSRVA